MKTPSVKFASTPVLDIAYESVNDDSPDSVVLLHGFPYDPRVFDSVVPILAERGRRVIVPYLRGFGPTRFLDPATLRSGQQAALGHDLVELLDALGVERAVVAGYDWGGRAACVAAAVFPDRIAGLVSANAYNIQHIAGSSTPIAPEAEATLWYQYYFHTERGRRGLEQNRDQLCELLWRTWSPSWPGAAEAFSRSSQSLHNPDFVDVVVHSYRHRYGVVDGDPRYTETESRLATRPNITVPTIVLESLASGLGVGPAAASARRFTGPFELRPLPGVGHNPAQEAPTDFARAVLDVEAGTP